MLTTFDFIAHLMTSLARVQERTGWEGWPFSGFGTLTFWGLLAKALLVAAIFMGLAYFLRYLFRPGSRWRGKDWETMEEAHERRMAEQNHTDRSSDGGNHDEPGDASGKPPDAKQS
jgi:hypothetical protein